MSSIHDSLAEARDALKKDLDATVNAQVAAMRGTSDTGRALNTRAASLRAEAQRRRAAGVAINTDGTGFDGRNIAMLRDTVAYHDENIRHLSNYSAGLAAVAKRALLVLDTACKAVDLFERREAEAAREAAPATAAAEADAERSRLLRAYEDHYRAHEAEYRALEAAGR